MSDYKVIFENENFYVLIKPASWLTIPGRTKYSDIPVLVNQAEEKTKQKLWVIHRLDFEVSGLLMFAKNSQAHALANHWFEHKKLTKSYEALVQMSKNNLQELNHVNQWKEFRCNIVRGKKRSFIADHGKESITKYQFLSIQPDGRSRIQCEPVTGRTHQLRVVLSSLGMPILGDVLYGSELNLRNSKIALFAYELNFSTIKEKLGLPDVINVKQIKEDYLDSFYV